MSEIFEKIDDTKVKITKTETTEETISIESLKDRLIMRQNQLSELNDYYQENRTSIQSEIDNINAQILGAKSVGVEIKPVAP